MAAAADAQAAIKRPSIFKLLTNVDPNVGGPRLGLVAIPSRKELSTPNYLAISSRGVVPHLSPDVLAAHTQFSGLHMALEDFAEKAGKRVPPVMTCPIGVSPLHGLTALPGSLITLLAPRRTPAVAASTSSTKSSVSLYTSTGFQLLPNSEYINSITALSPDLAIALGDVPYGVKAGAKRAAKMGDRTQKWVEELLALKRSEQPIFAPILPMDIRYQFEYIDYLSDEVVDQVAGLAFYDSNLLADMPASTAFSSLARLSLDEPASPHQILRQVALGMDIFTIPFIGFATDGGIALTFRFPTPLPAGREPSEEGSSLQPLGIDMWKGEHATALTPLSDSCTCYACTVHHRAFVQHLLSAKEMLGWNLLQIHNHHILSYFFAAIRESIAAGTFDEDSAMFARTYAIELPEKSGQGPRARGYQFKTEGPGETKKNKPAWGNLAGGERDGAVDSVLVPEVGAVELEEKGFAEAVVDGKT